jgi:aryl-alcohol dehydrogenase-like predicted oxidoreductase
MNYRTLGKTGLAVSEIGLGCEGFNGKSREDARALFRLAFEHGVNCMDLYTPNPAVHGFVADAMQDRRESFVLQAHLCTIWKKGQYECTRRPDEVKLAFEHLMRNLRTDYLDIGMIHFVDSPETWRQIAEGPVMEFALAQKKAGYIRHLGVSSHNPEAAIAAVKSGLSTC